LRNNIFFGAAHATQTKQTNSPSLNGIGSSDHSIQVVSALCLRQHGRQDWKLKVMLMICNPEMLSGKNFKVYSILYWISYKLELLNKE